MYKSNEKLTVLIAVMFPLKYLCFKIKLSVFVIQNVSYNFVFGHKIKII
jgi:hypothetical protein